MYEPFQVASEYGTKGESVAYPFDYPERRPDPFGREVHTHVVVSVSVLAAVVVGTAEYCTGQSVVD